MRKIAVILLFILLIVFTFACGNEPIEGKTIAKSTKEKATLNSSFKEFTIYTYTDMSQKELEKKVKEDLKAKGGKLSSIETESLKIKTKDYDIRFVSINYMAEKPITEGWDAYIKREKHETIIFSNVKSKERLTKKIKDLFEGTPTNLISLETLVKGKKYKVTYESPEIIGDFLKDYEYEWQYYNDIKVARRSNRIESFLDKADLEAKISEDLKDTNGRLISLDLIEGRESDDGIKTYNLYYAAISNSAYDDGEIIGPTSEEFLSKNKDKEKELVPDGKLKEFAVEVATDMSKKEFEEAVQKDLKAKGGELVSIQKDGSLPIKISKDDKDIKEVKLKNFSVKYTAKKELIVSGARYLKKVFNDDNKEIENYNVVITSRTRDKELLKQQISDYLKSNDSKLIYIEKAEEENKFNVLYSGPDSWVLKNNDEWLCKENTKIRKYSCGIKSFLDYKDLEKEINKLLKPYKGWSDVLLTNNSYCYTSIDCVTIIKGTNEIKGYTLEYRAPQNFFIDNELIGSIPQVQSK